MSVKMGVLTYASSLFLTSAALVLSHYTSLRSGCPVKSEEARGGINWPDKVAPEAHSIVEKDTCGSRS